MSDLKPGREMDALVAQHVMGWTLSHRGNCWNKNGKNAYSVLMWNPSTDIKAAWEVVEKLSKLSFQLKSSRNHRQDKDAYTHSARFGFNAEKLDRNYMADGVTAPHAICLAALKAVGYDG